jgi:outer membrane receptor protein involved in Fe transport
LRYYRDRRSFADASTTNTNVKGKTTWRANLSYLPTDNLTIFVTAATGFRAGIVQSRVQADLLAQEGIPAGTQLRPETSTDYEIGVKWRSPNQKVAVNLNGYITKYDDLQTSTPTADPSVSGFSNFGNATTKGIDFEIHWYTPLEGLELSAVGNVNTGHFDYVDPAVQMALPDLQPGTRIVNTIEHNWRLSASYNGTLVGIWDDFFNFSWSRMGNRLQTSGQYANPYSLINLTLGVRNGPYEIALYGQNLGDERGPTIVFGATPNSGSGPTPRTVGLRFRADFQ